MKRQAWATRIGVALFLLVILGPALPAAAQDVQKADVSGGYQFLSVKPKGDTESEKLKGGWYGDVAVNLNKMFAAVVDVGGNYKTITEGGDSFKLKVHEFMVGGRVSARKADMKIVPFGQVLVGGVFLKASAGTEHVSETDLGVLAGGGANIMPGGKVALRVGIDYFHAKAKKDGALLEGRSLNGFRFILGVVIGVGSTI